MSDTPEPELSVVVPVFNEEPTNLRLLIERLRLVLQPQLMFYEIVFVDDGSRSEANVALRQLAEEFSYVKLVILSRNFGEQSAITAGLEHARGTVVINMDSDLQDPPEFISVMLQYFREGYDVVYARQAGRKEHWFRQFLAFAFYRILCTLSTVKIPADVGEFRLLSRRAVNALCLMPEKSRFLRGLVPWIGFKQIVIPFDRDARIVGDSSYTWQKLLTLAIDGILSFSVLPLYAMPALGLALVIVGLFAAGFSFYYAAPMISGVSALLLSILLLLAGLQICCVGTAALYLGQVLSEIRARPTYIVAERIGWQNEHSETFPALKIGNVSPSHQADL